MIEMENKNCMTTRYSVEMELSKSTKEVFNHIIDLSQWWVEEFTGEKLKLNSEFILKIGDEHFSKNKVVEFVQDNRFVWVTTESRRNTDNFDWTGTKMIFELSPKSDGTLLTFTYDGVVFEGEQDRLKEICDYCIKDLLYNHIESFTATIEVAKSPHEVFNNITNDVAKWWGGKDLTGSSKKLNDEFIVHHPNAHYSKQKMIEVIPDKKIVWLVTESTMDWLQKDKHEWENTKMIFEITSKNDKTLLHFTHDGLIPGKECYETCEQGWTLVIKDWLFNFITTGEVKIESHYLKTKSFNRSISVSISVNEAIEKISKIPEWWGVSFSGSSQKKNDNFVINMGDDSFFNMTVVELIPNKKVVWLVTNCNMPWYSNKKEWLDTKLIFDFYENNGVAIMSFIHEGLTPDIECFKDCEFGWNHWITHSLSSYFMTGKGDFKQR